MIMKFLRGFLSLFLEMRLEDFKERLLSVFENFGEAVAVLKLRMVEINYKLYIKVVYTLI